MGFSSEGLKILGCLQYQVLGYEEVRVWEQYWLFGLSLAIMVLEEQLLPLGRLAVVVVMTPRVEKDCWR